jgi:Leucine-rich repeat (LRR) protein
MNLLGEMKNLNNLDLSDNFINILPKELFGLTNIKKLNLSYNCLGETETENIYKMTNLEELDLTNCGDYSDNICFLTNIKMLNLTNNHSGSYIKRFSSYLNLNKNNDYISFENYSKIGERIFNIRSSKITPIPNHIDNLKNLTTLILDSCKLESIPNSIYKLTNLINLSLKDNCIK